MKPGLLIGLLFTFEYVLIYRGLLYTSASRSVVYLYTAPIFVVIASRWFLPGERFTWLQWAGIVLSFSGHRHGIRRVVAVREARTGARQSP